MLALMPPIRKERTQFIARILEAGKKRWNWQVSAMCQTVDRNQLQTLCGSGGQIFSPPPQLTVAEWEHDPTQVAATERLMREAEIVAGLPLGRVILAGAHTVGRAFNTPVRHAPRYTIVRRVLTDNTEPLRIMRRLFRFADEILAAAKPDFVFAFEWATPLNFAIWMAAHRRGIPCVAIRYSKIKADQAFWTTDRLMLNTTAIARGSARRKSGAPVSDAAKAYIRAFREQPLVIKYIAVKWGNRTRRNFFRWHLEYARIVVREFINSFQGQDRALREPAIGRFFRYYRSLFMAYWHQRFLKTIDDPALADMKYIYFPMHKEAELAQTFQATLWHDQRNTIRVLASLLPAGYRLLVREHRFNYGQRPTRFYRQMSQIPNVILIDPFDSQFKYLRHADLVVTENGSSGWEALLLSRRTLLLSNTFYDGAGLGVRVTDPDRLNEAILDTLAKPAVVDPQAHDYALGCMIDGELETTFPMTSEAAPAALDLLDETLVPLIRPSAKSAAVSLKKVAS